MTLSFPKPDEPATGLVDVDWLESFCRSSKRHIYRLVDSGRMPAPIKLGRLNRWRRTEIEQWIANGCKPVRSGAAKGGIR